MNFKDFVSECDQLIRAGQFATASSKISELNSARVPREFLQALAKLCRRLNMIRHGLRLLQPIIRNEQEKIDPPSAGEICEYAVLLIRNGSAAEALGLLKSLDPAIPEVSLYSAYAHIANWDYAEAIPLLERFLKSNADDYSKLIANVNLIPAYLFVRDLEKAEGLLLQTTKEAEKAGASRLLGNCHEFQGRLHLYRGEFNHSRAVLKKGLEIFGATQIYDRLSVTKWLAVMAALEQKSVKPLMDFRREAVANKNWEYVREADLFTVKVEFNQPLLDHLTFGTPMPAYRERIQKEIGAQSSQTFIYGKVGGACLDLKTGKMDDTDDIDELNPGKKVHQVIAALIKDFYLHRNAGALFSDLYRDEYFDLDSSPRRVRELIRRTRQWLKDNRIPASIEQQDGSFRFVIHGEFGIRMSFERDVIETPAILWGDLKSKFPSGAPFSSKMACDALNWNKMKFHRVIEAALNTGQLVKKGQGKATVYEIPAKASFKTAA